MSDGEITGVPTGFYDLDKLTAGLHGGEFIILAARPAMGKTQIAVQYCNHFADTLGKPTVLFCLEYAVSTTQYWQRKASFSRERLPLPGRYPSSRGV